MAKRKNFHFLCESDVKQGCYWRRERALFGSVLSSHESLRARFTALWRVEDKWALLDVRCLLSCALDICVSSLAAVAESNVSDNIWRSGCREVLP